jgi:hypothetical protein
MSRTESFAFFGDKEKVEQMTVLNRRRKTTRKKSQQLAFR